MKKILGIKDVTETNNFEKSPRALVTLVMMRFTGENDENRKGNKGVLKVLKILRFCLPLVR